MSDKYSFPFGFEFVLNINHPNRTVYPSGNRKELRTDCPFCEAEGKMYWNTEKDTYYCQHCKSHGGMVQYHQRLNHYPTAKDAMRDLGRKYRDPDHASLLHAVQQHNSVQSAASLGTAASLEIRDQAYRNLIRSLPLSDIDRKDLHGRGLSDEAIERYGIRSVPVLCRTAARMMLKENYDFSRASFARYGSTIPGLYPENDEIYMVKLKPGILIPVVSRSGCISMMQVRFRPLPETADEKEKAGFHKYAQLSSAWKEGGCSTNSLEKIHHVGFDTGSGKAPESVCLTEGCLKADVASYLEGGKPYIAVLGVNNLKQLEEEFRWLIDHGTREIRIRFDMDFIENDTVAQAIIDVNAMLQKPGAVSILCMPSEENSLIQPCIRRFETMMSDSLLNKEGITYRKVYTAGELAELKTSGALLVFNDLWDPKYKGIDDYLHKYQTAQFIDGSADA